MEHFATSQESKTGATFTVIIQAALLCMATINVITFWQDGI
jgi:hypothetical protein